ncbi:ornithine cyclodeaminase family protein [Sulfuricystis multivorans]|uniref:ornithine cyclodeaminase family protein n=1 Tax=Sulfuricystis multivorans TaxID=2211108 RepID=UPI000F8214EF|nr:ornithine cyclodeaminase family protein [Sulfuricystis multivorans]
MALYLTEADVRQLLTMELALEAVEAAHRAHALGRAIDLPRQRTRVPTASLHILQGALLDESVMGYKAYTASKAGARFLVHLFDAADGRLLAVIEADFLGMMRTGAAGGIAAKHLARPDAAVVGMIGAGWQAQGQLAALCQVRPVRQVKLFSRNAERCRLASAEFAQRFRLDVVPMDSAEAAVRGSDIVVTITTSATPVVQGDWLSPGTHLNAAGSNALIRRELDEKAVGRATLVCVDSKATALAEAGDLLPALEKGRLFAGQLIELGEIVAGIRPGRADSQAITLFESQGMAIQDLAVARRLFELARTQGLGTQLPLT